MWRSGLARALVLGLVYAVLMRQILASTLFRHASSFPLGEEWALILQWTLLLGPALLYGAFVASWWALIVPGAAFAFALTQLGGPSILDPDINMSELVLLLAAGPTVAICLGVALRPLSFRTWVQRIRRSRS